MNIASKYVFESLPIYRVVNKTALPDTKKADLWDSLVTSPTLEAFAKQLRTFDLPTAERIKLMAFRRSFGDRLIGNRAIVTPGLLVGIGKLVLVGIGCILVPVAVACVITIFELWSFVLLCCAIGWVGWMLHSFISSAVADGIRKGQA